MSKLLRGTSGTLAGLGFGLYQLAGERLFDVLLAQRWFYAPVEPGPVMGQLGAFALGGLLITFVGFPGGRRLSGPRVCMILLVLESALSVASLAGPSLVLPVSLLLGLIFGGILVLVARDHLRRIPGTAAILRALAYPSWLSVCVLLFTFLTLWKVNLHLLDGFLSTPALLADALILILGGAGFLACSGNVIRRGGAPPGRTSWVRLTLPATLGTILLMATVVGPPDGFLKRSGPHPLEESAEHPSFVILLVDALRADHVGPELFPRLWARAGQAVRFPNAHAPSSWTLPSAASLLTGLYPIRHGAGSLQPGGSVTALYDSVVTLPERLRETGYTTGGFVSNAYLGVIYGLGRGFDTYVNRPSTYGGWLLLRILQQVIPVLHQPYWGAARALTSGLEWYRDNEGRARFLLVHLMDPHEPYTAHGLNAPALRPGREAALYAEELLSCDTSLDTFLSDLEELPGNTWVFFTADHGEEFADHGEGREDPYRRGTGHGHTLYEELLKVPLWILPPRGAGGVGARNLLVSLVDVAPTVADLSALDPLPGTDGRSFRSCLGKEAPGIQRILVAEALRYGTQRVAALDRRHKVIYCPESGSLELYDLVRDPGEQDPLPQAEMPEQLWQALEEHISWLPSARSREAPSLSPEARERLRSLGYLQ